MLLGKFVEREEIKTNLESEETYKWTAILKAQDKGYFSSLMDRYFK